MDEDIKRQSDFMYWALCEIIGDEDMVKLQRASSTLTAHVTQMICESRHRKYISRLIPKLFTPYFRRFDIHDIIQNHVESAYLNFDFLDSGSRAEGFDFSSSDYDFMTVWKDFKVIQSPTQERPSQSNAVLSVEKDYTRPGFVRLKALYLQEESYAGTICSMALTKLEQRYYLSSRKWIEMLFFVSLPINGYQNIHGPCLNETRDGKEIDFAHTLSSETWPIEAVGCVHRLIKRGWPSHDVIRDMVSDGCLFVPIGCKSSPYADIEWRMSFSLAEKRLVHSMNHTQFLTYGLLKLFLKEVVDKNDATKGLLCSYFMKTLVFWEIIETKTPWTPSFFLQNVWNCYRRLLTWIKNEYCPNFFIPENNMFYGKIYGRTRKTLLSLLYRHYSTGHLVFFEIPSIKNKIDKRSQQRRFEICNVLRRSHVIDKFYSNAIIESTHMFELNEVLNCSHLNYMVEFQDFIRIYYLNLTFFKKWSSDISKVHCNKTKYLNEKSICRLIKVSSPDCVQSKIFLAIYFYRCKRYGSCIRSLHKAIQKLEDERTVLMWKFDPGKYVSLGGNDISISEGMRKFTASNVPLDSCTCIPEISDICNTQTFSFLFKYISPWVLSNFLLCLCHFWKGDVTQARIHLEYIRFCLENRGCLISINPHYYFEAWHILGIGQEILGDFQDALISYGECTRSMEARIKPFFLDILELTETKISRLMSLLHSQEQLYRDKMLKTPG